MSRTTRGKQLVRVFEKASPSQEYGIMPTFGVSAERPAEGPWGFRVFRVFGVFVVWGV